jgi:hypothetical protein
MGTIAILVMLGGTSPASAVEYRLQVVSLYNTAFASFLQRGELADGASGPGLDGLEASLDAGRVPNGVILADRRVQPVRERLGSAYGGSRVIPASLVAREGPTSWDEIVWDGKPGERSVWLVSPTMRNVQELSDTALKGFGPLRHYQPLSFPLNGRRVSALSLPLNFLWFYADRGTIWDKYLSRGLDLKEGIGAVIGVNTDSLFPDQAYLIVEQPEQPTTYKAVLVWRERNAERQAPGKTNPVIIR